ncbi:MAG: hypothetical protein AAFV53_10000 [Myxococcota bacterium]
MWWLWFALAFAQEEANSPSSDDSPPDEEIIIYGDRIQAARRDLHQSLLDLGYTPKRRKDGRTLYMPPWKQRWKPRVIVDDDGFAQFRSPQFVFQGVDLGLQPEPFEDIPGTVTNQGVRVGVRFWITSGRKLVWQQQRLSEAMEPSLRTLRDAISDEAHAKRMQDLPGELDAIWLDVSSTPERRRHALTEQLLRCADTPEGRERRDAIWVYLSEVVQTSAYPFPDAAWHRLTALVVRETQADESIVE